MQNYHNIQIMHNMKNVQNEICKTKPTKLSLSRQNYWTKPSKPNLFNQTYQIKSAEFQYLWIWTHISHALSLRVLRKDFVIFLVKAVSAWVRSAFGSDFYSILGVGNWDSKTPSPYFRQKMQFLNCWGSNNLINWWDFIPLWWVFRHSCGQIPTSPKILSGGTGLWAFCNFVFQDYQAWAWVLKAV